MQKPTYQCDLLKACPHERHTWLSSTLSSMAAPTAEPAAHPAALPTSPAITAPARPPKTVPIGPTNEPTTAPASAPDSAIAMPLVAPATLPSVLPALRARSSVLIREELHCGQRGIDPDDGELEGAALVRGAKANDSDVSSVSLVNASCNSCRGSSMLGDARSPKKPGDCRNSSRSLMSVWTLCSLQ